MTDDNVIPFPRKGVDEATIQSVADALRTCVIHSHDTGVIDTAGMHSLLTVLDTIEALWHNMIEE